MAKGIEIGVAADTKAFKQGVETGLIKPLEDAQDALDDLGKSKGPDQLERGLEGAQDASERLQRETKQTADTIEREFKSSYRAMKQSSETSTTSAKQNLEELGNEAKANLAETLSSFDGTIEGTISGIQGTLGGVTAGLTGVVPIIAAAAGAAGLGLIATAFQTAGENAEKVRAKVGELAAELIETGGVGQRSLDNMVESLKALATESEDGEKSLSDLQKTARKAGLEFSTIAQAYVGNSKELAKLIRKQEEYKDALDDEASALDITNQEGSKKYGELQKQASAIDSLTSTLRQNLDVAKKAEQAERDYAASGAPEMEAKLARIQSIDKAYDDAAGSTQDYIIKESGLFDTKKYIKAMQAREKALLEYQDTLAASGLSDEAKTFLESQGQESAALMLAGYKRATPATKAELSRIWSNAGSENSGSYGNAFQKGLPKNSTFPVKPVLDQKALQNQLNAAKNSITLVVDAIDRTGKKIR